MSLIKIENIKVEKDDLTEELLDYYSLYDLLSVDCEMMGLNPIRDRLCLIQLCNKEGKITLVQITDPKPNLKPELRTPNLKKLFENPKVKKLFHYGRTDLTFLYHWLGIDLVNVFCTKSASKLVRTFTDKHSLKDLVRDLLNRDLDKTSQSSDWGAPELTNDQIKYAASDVIHLIPLYEKLIPLLQRENRFIIAETANTFLPTLAKLDLFGYQDFFAH